MFGRSAEKILNAFCVDLEEWFHVCGVRTDFKEPVTWKGATSCVERDTEVLLRILDDYGTKATFMTVGWVAERYPELIKNIASAGHEIGCHSYFHRLIFDLTPEEFEEDLVRALDVLRSLSGQAVRSYRAPGFSMTRECFWAFPILRKHGIEIDASIVPATRDHGGVDDFIRDPFLLRLEEGDIKCFPVSVMNLAGRTIPFSGGGYLRLFPASVIKAGYWQNHRKGRPGMSYIHPREINPEQPRLRLPVMKRFKYYVNVGSTEDKLRNLLTSYRFSTLSDSITEVQNWPTFDWIEGEIQEA
jgi:polysaccharide deacetylase family protein (PEP-CTERM system associated)